MKITHYSFEELTQRQLYQILQLRSDVFVLEQKSFYRDMDDCDQKCIHVLAYEEEKLIGYCRILPPALLFPTPSIGRLIATQRKAGIGTALLNDAKEYIENHYKDGVITIEAQVSAQAFYQKNGFRKTSEPFDDAGIYHIEMKYFY